MKMITNKKTLEAITFRLPEDLLAKLTELAEKNDISKQKLVTAILRKAIEDKNYKVEIKD